MMGKSLLVLSEHAVCRAVVADRLEAQGAVTVESESLQHATAILRKFRFDGLAVHLIDVGMGLIDFLRDVSLNDPSIQILLVGGAIDGRVLPGGMAAGQPDLWREACPTQVTKEGAETPTLARKRNRRTRPSSSSPVEQADKREPPTERDKGCGKEGDRPCI